MFYTVFGNGCEWKYANNSCVKLNVFNWTAMRIFHIRWIFVASRINRDHLYRLSTIQLTSCFSLSFISSSVLFIVLARSIQAWWIIELNWTCCSSKWNKKNTKRQHSSRPTFNLNTNIGNGCQNLYRMTVVQHYYLSLWTLYSVVRHHSMPHSVDSLAFRMITTISSLSFSIRVHTDQVMPNSISL